jgi:Ankyrin repeats (many copies)
MPSWLETWPKSQSCLIQEISTRLGAEDWGKHPLHAAAASGSLDVVQLLLGRGASPNTLDYASDPPLWHAVEHGLVEMVQMLLDSKCTTSDIASEVKVRLQAAPAASGSLAHACTWRNLAWLQVGCSGCQRARFRGSVTFDTPSPGEPGCRGLKTPPRSSPADAVPM